MGAKKAPWTKWLLGKPIVALPCSSRRLLSSCSLSAGVGPSSTRLKAATDVSAQNGRRTMPGLDPALCKWNSLPFLGMM